MTPRSTHPCFTVDGRPFLSIGGQARNSSAFNREDTDVACRAVATLGGNTVALPVSWELFEPEEGRFDRSLVHRIIDQAREHGLRLVVLWFATWKNGTMEYAPTWVKTDQERFPRTRYPDGSPTFVLSCHAAANREADALAFAELMATIRDHDAGVGTVIGVQVENEPGIYAPVRRDFGPEGERDFRADVPPVLLAALREHPGSPIAAAWCAAGSPSGGSWSQVFGDLAAEVCTTWHVATYVNAVAARGRAVHDLPLTANVWVDTGFWGVGGLDYPCGGAVHETGALDVWRAACPDLDLICPDVYVADERGYRETIDAYADPDAGWPLFVPESANRNPNTAFMFHALGARGAIGQHVFGIEELVDTTGAPTATGEVFARSFAMLRNIERLLVPAREAGAVHAIVQAPGQRGTRLPVRGWLCAVTYVGPDFRWNGTDFRHLAGLAEEFETRSSLDDELARGLLVQTGPDEFFLVGHGMRVFFQPPLDGDGAVPYSLIGPTHQAASLPTLAIEEGRFADDGRFVVDRVRTGDEARHGIWLAADCGVVRVLLTPGG